MSLAGSIVAFVRRYRVLVFVSLVLVLFGSTLVWGQIQEKRELSRFLGLRYQDAFYRLLEHVEALEVLLGKALVSTGPEGSIPIYVQIMPGRRRQN